MSQAGRTCQGTGPVCQDKAEEAKVLDLEDNLLIRAIRFITRLILSILFGRLPRSLVEVRQDLDGQMSQETGRLFQGKADLADLDKAEEAINRNRLIRQVLPRISPRQTDSYGNRHSSPQLEPGSGFASPKMSS
jgi:hypothetical protein